MAVWKSVSLTKCDTRGPSADYDRGRLCFQVRSMALAKEIWFEQNLLTQEEVLESVVLRIWLIYYFRMDDWNMIVHSSGSQSKPHLSMST